MNKRGEEPVIVLNPVYPSVLGPAREVRLRGPPGDAGEDRRLPQALQVRLRRRAGHPALGQPGQHDWSNATHVNRANMRRLLRYVVAHSAGALR